MISQRSMSSFVRPAFCEHRSSPTGPAAFSISVGQSPMFARLRRCARGASDFLLPSTAFLGREQERGRAVHDAGRVARVVHVVPAVLQLRVLLVSIERAEGLDAFGRRPGTPAIIAEDRLQLRQGLERWCPAAGTLRSRGRSSPVVVLDRDRPTVVEAPSP